MKEWTDEDEVACEAAYKTFMYNDQQIQTLEDKRSWIKGSPERYSLAEDKELAAEITRLKGELDLLNNGEAVLSTKGLDVFKNMKRLTAREVTVWLLRKDEKVQMDRVRIEARGTKRTVTCLEIGLISKKNGLLNREGKMLLALSKDAIAKEIKSHAQAMTKLRNIFRGIIGTEADPFMPKKRNWQPRFILKDAIQEADKRAASRALPASERIRNKPDEADKWLAEHDNKLPS